MPIKGVHTMFYSSDAQGLRQWLKDKIGLSAHDIGEGWLIFDLPEADMGVHPTDTADAQVPSGRGDISFYCDDLAATMRELEAKGVEFKGETEDYGYALVNYMRAPGDFWIQLYQPHYQK